MKDEDKQETPPPCETCFRRERCEKAPVDCYRFDYWAETGKAA
jgi:hypothetical protein